MELQVIKTTEGWPWSPDGQKVWPIIGGAFTVTREGEKYWVDRYDGKASFNGSLSDCVNYINHKHAEIAAALAGLCPLLYCPQVKRDIAAEKTAESLATAAAIEAAGIDLGVYETVAEDWVAPLNDAYAVSSDDHWIGACLRLLFRGPDPGPNPKNIDWSVTHGADTEGLPF